MGTEQFKVLLVEDNASEAALMQDMLSRVQSVKFLLAHVDRFAKIKQHLREGSPDVILLDLSLPDSTGLSTFEKVRQEAPWIPIIIVTNVQDEEVAVQAVREGAQDYLVKREINTDLLVRSIRYAIERVHAEEALRRSEERYALAVRGANDGLWDWDLIENTVYYSPRWKAMLGYQDTEIGTTIEEWFNKVHPDDIDGLNAVLTKHLEGESEHFEYEHRLQTKKGGVLWGLSRGLVLRDSAGKPYRMAGSLTDTTVRKWTEEQLLHHAFNDVLTLLPNRALFLDRVAVALGQCRRNKRKRFAVLFLDLDRFKTINDSLGHTVGDKLLVEIARRLEQVVRPGDTVARLGGDEFAILLNDVKHPTGTLHVVERINNILTRKFIIDDHEIFTSASTGIALSANNYLRPEEILRDADIAMYRAKSSGTGQYVIFNSDMHDRAVALQRLETDLRHAVEREEFTIHYQPIVSLKTRIIIGFEALLRWQHPFQGLILPDKFLPIAEETGLIIPIQWWVFEEACRKIRIWQKLFPTEPPLQLSVNIPGKLFTQADMVDKIVKLLAESELSARSLRLEITENALMDHGDAALAKLAKLRALGVQLHIDDFGTGYCSLSYLQRFSYDSLKIDRSFVSNVGDKGEGSAIVQTIIALGKMLEMNIIAEGVETTDQFKRLHDMDCPHAQGNWFSQPLDEIDTQAFLTNYSKWKH